MDSNLQAHEGNIKKAFALTFLKINTDKSIIDLLLFAAMGCLLVFGGIFLNYLLSNGK